MLFNSVTSLIVALGVTILSKGSQAASVSPPQLEWLFSASLNISSNLNPIAGPFGTRINAEILDGNVTDPSGNIVATLLPGLAADQGIISASGTFFPDAKIAWQWKADQKIAYLHAKGVGVAGQEDTTYVELETDSDQYSSLNSRFLIGKLTFNSATSASFNIFGEQ